MKKLREILEMAKINWSKNKQNSIAYKQVPPVYKGNFKVNRSPGASSRGGIATMLKGGSRRKVKISLAPIKASDDNIQIRDPNNGNNLTINVDGSINIGNFPSSTSVTQGTSPWVISGTITANAGTNLNTSLLALDSTVAKDASLTTINTSINTLLKSANTLTAVTTLGTITNVVHVDDNAGSLTIDQPTASNLNAQVVGNIASAATDSGNPVKVGAVFNSTLAAITNGQRSNLQTNQFGELAVIIRNKFLNVHGAATTVVKSGSGRLNALVFNSGTSSSIVTIYDNIVASGTIIATINPANSGPFYLQYNAEFSTGLTVTTTVSATDITVLYQ